jgi:hypothetical protein
VVRNNQKAAGDISLPRVGGVKIAESPSVSTYGKSGTSRQYTDDPNSYAAYQQAIKPWTPSTAGEKTINDYFQNKVNRGSTLTDDEIKYADAMAALVDQRAQQGEAWVDINSLLAEAKAQREFAQRTQGYTPQAVQREKAYLDAIAAMNSDPNKAARVSAGREAWADPTGGQQDLSGLSEEEREYFYYLLSDTSPHAAELHNILERANGAYNPQTYDAQISEMVSTLKMRGDYADLVKRGKTPLLMGGNELDSMREQYLNRIDTSEGGRLYSLMTEDEKNTYYAFLGAGMKKEAAQCQLNDFRFDYLYYLI